MARRFNDQTGGEIQHRLQGFQHGDGGVERFRVQRAEAFIDEERTELACAGMGGDGVRVNTRAELQAALEHAVATRGRFQLIDITIPRGVLSRTLSRFVAGVKRLNAPAAAQD